jgi:hypothetical protein
MNALKIVQALLLSFVLTSTAQARMVDAPKADTSRILITKFGEGFVTGKTCKNCKLLTFTTTKNTVAKKQNDKQVGLQKANEWSGKTVLFLADIKTQKPVQIMHIEEVEG